MGSKKKSDPFKKRFMEIFAEISAEFPLITREKTVEVAINRLLSSPEDDALISLVRARQPMDEENYAAALPFLQKAFELDPGNKDIIPDLAICFFETGHYSNALPLLTKVSKKHPQDISFAFMKAYALFKNGDRNGIRLLEKMQPDFPDLLAIFPAQMKDVFYCGLRALRKQGPAHKPG